MYKNYNFQIEKSKIKETDNKFEGEIKLAEIKQKGPKVTLELIYQEIIGIKTRLDVLEKDVNELKQDIVKINNILERNNLK